MVSKKKLQKMKEVVLLGNPNCGKTSIFNELTGLRQITANYPGVTVEKKTGYMTFGPFNEAALVLDLPGAYSLLPRSMDEEVVHDVLLGIQKGTPAPDLVVIVLDASNLERNMYLASQVVELGLPVVFDFNMWDVAEQNGLSINIDELQNLTGIPCVKTVGNKGIGIGQLKQTIQQQLDMSQVSQNRGLLNLQFPEEIERELALIISMIQESIPGGGNAARGEAIRLISDTRLLGPLFKKKDLAQKLDKGLSLARLNLEKMGVDWNSFEAEKRYEQIEEVLGKVVQYGVKVKASISERLDQIMTHRFWGLAIFIGVMGIVFQSIFSWASLPMDLISSFVDWFGGLAIDVLPDGQLESLVVDGIIAGVGNVVVFLPQIFLLFFFVALFEDFGYMARAAFVLDRVMKKVGLNGKAFLPLLSSFACAIPGIMATRTIQDRNDRFATILVAPLMSCSARLPVYTLMIAAFIPSFSIFGLFNLKGLTLLVLYFLSIFIGLGMAALFRKTLLKGEKTPFVFELPPYRIPNLRTIILAMWDRGKEFLYRAGSIIFCVSIILWFLVSYPKNQEIRDAYNLERTQMQLKFDKKTLDEHLSHIDREEAGDLLRESYAGKLGKMIEPVIRPLGFDWKIGIGLIGSFAAREVLVSTLAIVHNVGREGDETSVNLVKALRSEVSSETGKPTYTPLVAISLMVFFVLACQCMSTVAIVRRETNSWRWPIFMVSYMTMLAWIGSFLVYQGGKLIGLD